MIRRCTDSNPVWLSSTPDGVEVVPTTGTLQRRVFTDLAALREYVLEIEAEWDDRLRRIHSGPITRPQAPSDALGLSIDIDDLF